MKTSLFKIASLASALTLLLSSCAYVPDEQQPAADESAQYQQTIATLEKELAAQREQYALSESQYKAEIAALQAQLAVLSEKEPAQTDQSSVEFRYRTENGGAVITGYRGTLSLLCIPETLDGLPVIAIGERAFEGASFTAVVLPNGLGSIGWFAFYGCENLINVTIPASVSSIGYAVFDGCGELTVYCPFDSYAARYAQSYGLSYITS
ncbi:MAG: hypothetical protein E7624_09485 [Ruminococcaceae bacterium]|nr:hypothetical protein [Oscillospiraceae bacterium]